MNKINNKTIFISLGILAIFAFGIVINPKETNAAPLQYGGYISTISPAQYDSTPASNPSPKIDLINPTASNLGTGTKTITITGSGFVPSSIVRINGSNRPTTFVDDSHLLLQITGNDTYKYFKNGGFYVTVFNGAPGGGYSNAIFFKINKPANYTGTTATVNTNNTNSGDTVTDFTDTFQDNDENEGYSDLAGSAIMGASGVPYIHTIDGIS